jgi:hypothetical protein
VISLERQAHALWMMTEALDEDDPNRWAFKQVAEDMEDRITRLKKRLWRRPRVRRNNGR